MILHRGDEIAFRSPHQPLRIGTVYRIDQPKTYQTPGVRLWISCNGHLSHCHQDDVIGFAPVLR